MHPGRIENSRSSSRNKLLWAPVYGSSGTILAPELPYTDAYYSLQVVSAGISAISNYESNHKNTRRIISNVLKIYIQNQQIQSYFT